MVSLDRYDDSWIVMYVPTAKVVLWPPYGTPRPLTRREAIDLMMALEKQP